MGNDNVIFDDMLKLKEAVIFIRKESIKGNLVEKISLAETFGIEEGEVEPLLARMLDFPEFIELKRVMDSEGNEYLYSASEMTDRYVEILMGLKNKDLLKLIAETVRYESQKYPRPTRADLFTKKPYNISLEDLGELLESIGEESDYKDLKFTEASNGTRFIYSEQHMTKFYATKLAEWYEVLQYEIP